MQIGLIGLGRMGMNMAIRWKQGGHEVIAYNRTAQKTRDLVAEHGVEGAYSLEELIQKLQKPRIVWMMVPAGDATEQMMESVMPLMEPGDILVDGANSNWQDSVRRSKIVESKGLRWMDAGVSGGIWGLKIGYCTMCGSSQDVFDHLEPLLKTLAPPDGYALVGPAGAGHFVKMVHNGIEYGMMQAYAEGFEILHASQFKPDLEKVAKLWNHGSVVRSWLLELAERAFEEDPGLEDIRGYVEDSGEGRWTVQAAIDEDVPAPVITLSLMMRFRSRQTDSFSAKVNAALRNQFGGHAVKMADNTSSGVSFSPDQAGEKR